MRLFKVTLLALCVLCMAILAGCPPVTGIVLLVAKSTITVGETTNAAATSFDSEDAITWESSAPAVATVDTVGKITGVSKGKATITATGTVSKKSASAEVTVVEAPAAEGEGEGEAQVPDTKAPVIILLGSQSVALTAGATYTDAGASALDDVDGNITADIVVAGVPTSPVVVGVYTVTYDVSDAAGNDAVQVTRTVTVNAAAPTLVLLSSTPPIAAACTACHDAPDALAHAEAMSPGGVDTCELCHSPGAIADPAMFHVVDPVPGLNVTILSIDVTPVDEKPVVTFQATDEDGNPVPKSELRRDATRGGVRIGVAYLGTATADRPNPYYTCYLPNRTDNPTVANLDPVLTELGGGLFTFKFITASVGITDPSKLAVSHKVAGQFYRLAPDGTTYIANAYFHFRPDGDPAVETREIVETGVCNKCHTKLALHGGARTEVQYCIMCHNPQLDAFDADFPEMIHKIHTGDDNLFREEGEGEGPFAHVGLPKPYENVTIDCTQCHQGAPNADAYQDASAKGCLSCHTSVDPVTGTGHPIATSAACNLCHFEAEGGVSIVDAHESMVDFDRLTFSVADPATDISIDADTGLLTVKFSATLGGNPVSVADLKAVAPNALYSVGIIVNWLENGEYQQTARTMSSVAARLVDNGDGTVTYTGDPTKPSDVLPVDASYVYTVAFTGYRYLDRDDDPNTSYMSGANVTSTGREFRVPMAYFEPIQFKQDGSAVPAADLRRVSVSDANCAGCHDAERAGHGGSRVGVKVCLMCHTYDKSSTPRTDITKPTVSVQFKVLIHKIHRGEDLESEYITGGFGGDFDASEILFPGRLEKCTICHVSDAAVALPLSEDALPTEVWGNPARGK